MLKFNETKFSTIRFNGIDSKFKNIFVAEKISIPFAQKKIKSVPVIGRNGNLTIDDNTYEDVEIHIKFYIYGDEIIAKNSNTIRNWLTNIEDNKLLLPQGTKENVGVYFRVKYVKIENLERANKINKRLFKFGATFVCEPFQYISTGISLDMAHINGKSYTWNSTNVIPSTPLFKIKGEGLITLTVNGKEVVVDVGQSCIIDTKRRICYKNDGTFRNTKMKGDYENLYFKNGENIITWDGNIKELDIIDDEIVC